ncbi:hypothetical protein RIF29_17445 [Crotalaria pallida]|uniref:Uncharacterized protein n=1 Tax=Crotalaria pallida TaxID=3830 RepID=A0AAN9FJB8_CROPI
MQQEYLEGAYGLQGHTLALSVKESSGNYQLSSQSSQLDCCLNPHSSPANTTITTTTRLSSSAMSTGENCGQSTKISSIMLHEGVVNARDLDDEDKFKGFLGCSNNYVETSLSVGLSSSMFGQKSPNILPCGDRTIMSCKRVKTNISSMPVMKFLKPCSNGRGLAFQQSAEVILGGVNNHPGIIEDLDLELRLGKQQKVK